MAWEFRPVFDAAARAAVEQGKNLVYVCPPAAWATAPLFAELGPVRERRLDRIVLVADGGQALDLARCLAAQRDSAVLAATHASRAARLLGAAQVGTLATTPAVALELIEQARLKPADARYVVVAWPALHHQAGGLTDLEIILSEARGVARIVVTDDPAADAAFLERHARRAPHVSASPPPATPVAAARFAVLGPRHVVDAVHAALDGIAPDSALVWDPRPAGVLNWDTLRHDPAVTVSHAIPDQPVRVAFATALPSAAALAALGAAARQVIVFVRATEVGYLRRLAHPLAAFPLPSAADDARRGAAALRAALRERLAAGTTDSLLALAPLFEEYDPALVAAAAVAPTTDHAPAPARPQVPTWAALRLTVGRRDHVRPADIVGLLLNAVGLAKDQVGLIDIRDAFSVAYVRAEVAERAVRGAEGQLLRGRRVGARIEQ